VKQVRWLLAAGAAAALVAAGCGDDDSDGEAASAAATATASAAAPAKCDGTQVTYQLGFIPNPQYVGFLVALDKGFFEDEGIKMEMKPGGPTVNPALQLAQGTVDMTDLPLSDALNAISKGGNLKLVAQTAQQTPLRYISWKDVPLATPEDLKGKSVGIQQAGNVTPEMAEMLNGVGLSQDDVTVKTINFDVSDFMAKKIDVFPLRTYAHIAMLQGEGVTYPDDVNVLDPNEYGAGLPDEGIYVNGDFLSENGDAVVCTLRAIYAGWEATQADPAEAKKIMTEYAPAAAFSPEAIDVDVDETVKYATTNSDGETVEPLSIDVDYITDGAQKLHDSGAVKGDVDIASVIDPGPLEQARAEGGS